MEEFQNPRNREGKGRDSSRRTVGASSVALGSPMLSNKNKYSYFSGLGFSPHPSDTKKVTPCTQFCT